MHGAKAAPAITLAFPTDDELEAWVKDIYKNSTKAGLHIPTIQAYANKFWEGVQDGYGKGFEDVGYGDVDFATLAHLRKNVYHFSAAKNHAELKALTSKVVTDGGRVRSWEQFRKEAEKITGTFRGSWLQAEYELAVAGGQMARKWDEFERTGDDTMLRYSTVKDGRVSDICRPLEGITKPITDSFWDRYYPPNHYRCRCDVDRIPYSTGATAPESTPAPEIPKMLQTNLAKQGLVFPPKHPYYNGFTSSTLEKSFMNKPIQEHFITPKGQNYEIHTLAHYLPEFQDKNSWGRVLANAERLSKIKDVELKVLPELVGKKVEALKKMVVPGTTFNPDYLINGHYADLKSASKPTTEKSFINRINNASKQTKFPIIELIDSPSKNEIKKWCERRLKPTELQGLIVFDKNGKVLYKNIPKKQKGE